MSEKISAMPPAVFVFDDDVMPIVQGGVNFKASKRVLLTYSPPDDLTLQGLNSFFQVDSNDNLNVQVGSTVALTVQDDIGNIYSQIVAGGVQWSSAPGAALQLDGGNGQGLILAGDGSIDLVPSPGFPMLLGYDAATATDWTNPPISAGAAPTDVWAALDLIAAAAAGGHFGGLAIGDPVGSSTAGSLLFVDPSNDLGNSSNLLWEVSSGSGLSALSPVSGVNLAVLASSAFAGHFQDGFSDVYIGDNSGNAIRINTGLLEVQGTGGATIYFFNGVGAPGLSPGTPVNCYGGDTNYCGDPSIWVYVNVQGVYYRIPCFPG